MKHPLNIKFKLTLWYLLFLLIVFLFFGSVSYLILRENSYHTASNPVNTVVFGVTGPNAAGANPVPSSSLDQTYRPLFEYGIDGGQLLDIQSSTSSPLPISTPRGVITVDQKSFITSGMIGSQEIWLYYRPSVGQPGYYEILAVTQSKSDIMGMIKAFKDILIIALPAAIILAGCLGYFLVKRMLKPVEDITRTAREIQKRDLSRRIEISSNDEIGRLSAALNEAFESVQKSMERERQFTDNASHELQTPLAIVRGEATLALSQERSQEDYRKALESISDEVSRLVSTVNKLLILARADGGREQLNFTDIKLRGLLGDIAADIRLLCESKGIGFQSNLPENIVVKGDEIKLRQLFLNILDNAMKYTPSGGRIMLTLSKGDGTARIDIEDTGIGIATEHLPHIFERFYRVNKTHGSNDDGSGLGLAISRQIAEVHRGQIEVQSTRGIGSRFTITLPLSGN